MTCLRFMTVGLLLTAPLAADAQSKKRDAIVIFKDGFHIKGRINESVRDVVYDRASGMSFPVLSGQFFIDDIVRNIVFSPTHVTKVLQFKPGEIKEPMQILRQKTLYQPRSLNHNWIFESFSKWDQTGHRKITIRANVKGKGEGTFEITHRMVILSPRYIHVGAIDYDWNLMLYPQELGPEMVRPILDHIFNELPDLKKLKPAEKYLQIAAFMQEAGWFDEAEKELENIIAIFPADKKTAEEMLEKLKKERAEIFVESIEKASNLGQHLEAMDRLESYERGKLDQLVSPKNKLMALDLKVKYEKSKRDIDDARRHLTELTKRTSKANFKHWLAIAEAISEELNHDTIGRLATFLPFAQQHEMNRKENKKQQQTVEEVLALAVTGWLQGDQAAEPDVKTALKLARARKFVLDYLAEDFQPQRKPMLDSFKRDSDLPIDVMVRLLRILPPAQGLEAKALTPTVQTMKIEVPGGNGGSYLLQLPPDYHHLRPHPVLIILHGGRDKAEDTLRRFSDEAAKNGFILAAPLWTGNNLFNKNKGTVGPKEHAIVVETLLDLRRRLNVDCDRAFLFGWEDGGTLAFDVGLGHPDCFAGVAPMCGTLQPFTERFYWPNAQYLPFYVVEGERTSNAKVMQKLFKDKWTREPFVSMYVEYKGRASEWFSEEVPRMLSWMSKKKRHTPMKEMGQANLSGGLGVEFRTTRPSDGRFYWLSTEAIVDRALGDHTLKTWPPRYQPATLQANLSIGNKSDKDGAAKIWNRVDLRVSGLKQLSFWIAPGMLDLTKPLAVNVNGQQVGGMRTIQPSLETLLEDLYNTGDRQRLFVARVDLRF